MLTFNEFLKKLDEDGSMGAGYASLASVPGIGAASFDVHGTGSGDIVSPIAPIQTQNKIDKKKSPYYECNKENKDRCKEVDGPKKSTKLVGLDDILDDDTFYEGESYSDYAITCNKCKKGKIVDREV